MNGLVYPWGCEQHFLWWIFYYMSHSPVTDTQTHTHKRKMKRVVGSAWIIEAACKALLLWLVNRREEWEVRYYRQSKLMFLQHRHLPHLQITVENVDVLQWKHPFLMHLWNALLLHSWNKEWQSRANIYLYNTCFEKVFIRWHITISLFIFLIQGSHDRCNAKLYIYYFYDFIIQL